MPSDAANELTWYEMPELRRPLLLMAFEGLFDAAEAASGALDWLRRRLDSESVAMIDPERFFNFQEARPSVRIDQAGSRVIDWPTTELFVVRDLESSPHDLLIMTGTEPHLRWPTFAQHVRQVAVQTGCEMVVTLGAYIGMVPHSRPFTVTGSAIDPMLAERLQLSQPSYEGPTGVIGVINADLESVEVPVVSLRVEVPHYVPGAPNPKAKQALLRRLEATVGVTTGYEELDELVTEWVMRVDEAVASDDDSRDYVARLERQVDSDEESLPTGDDLAAEFEAFLRDKRAIRDAVDQLNQLPDIATEATETEEAQSEATEPEGTETEDAGTGDESSGEATDEEA